MYRLIGKAFFLISHLIIFNNCGSSGSYTIMDDAQHNIVTENFQHFLVGKIVRLIPTEYQDRIKYMEIDLVLKEKQIEKLDFRSLREFRVKKQDTSNNNRWKFSGYTIQPELVWKGHKLKKEDKVMLIFETTDSLPRIQRIIVEFKF